MLPPLGWPAFDPRAGGGGGLRGTAPSPPLPTTHTQLICGMTLSLLEGLPPALGQPGMGPRLDPAPGHCCVRLAPEHVDDGRT